MIRRELIAGGNGIDIIKFIMSFAVITIYMLLSICGQMSEIIIGLLIGLFD